MSSKSNCLAISYSVIAAIMSLAYFAGGVGPLLTAFGLDADFSYLFICIGLVVLGFICAALGANRQAIVAAATTAGFVVLTTNQEPLTRYLILAAILFCIGVYGMIVSRNAIRVLMSIELMLNAVNINLVAFARYIDPANVKGQLFAIFILTVAAAEAAVGLAIVLAIYRNMSTVNMEKFSELKW